MCRSPPQGPCASWTLAPERPDLLFVAVTQFAFSSVSYKWSCAGSPIGTPLEDPCVVLSHQLSGPEDATWWKPRSWFIVSPVGGR